MKAKKLFLILALILLIGLVFTACSTGMVKIEFYVDGQPYKTFWVKSGESFSEVVEVPAVEGMIGQWSTDKFDEVTSDMRVDAVYTNAYCYVTFEVDGREYRKVKVAKNGSISNALLPEVPIKDGYVGVWNYTNFNKITQDLRVKAIYSPAQYLVSFEVNGEIIQNSYIDYGGNVDNIPAIPAVIGKNYSSEWLQEFNDDGMITYKKPEFQNIKNNATYVANYFITVNLVDSYNDIGSVKLNINQSTETEFAVGVNGNNIFDGWYYEEEYINKVVFPVTFEGNCTLYARWMSAITGSDFTYKDGEVIGYTGTDTSITVPYQYSFEGKTYIVKGIAENAFLNNKNLLGISLPGSLRSIGANAFSGCSNLADLTLRDKGGLTRIGDYAFYNCESLKGLAISKYATDIGKYAFYNCISARTLGDFGLSSIKSIGEYTFYKFGKSVSVANAQDILETTITVPKTVVNIGSFAFADVKYDIKFADVDNVTTLGDYSFDNCLGLSSFASKGLIKVGRSPFRGCHGLKTVAMLSDSYLFSLFHMFGDGDSVNNELTKCYAVNYGGNKYYVPNTLNNVLVVANIKNQTTLIESGTLISDAFYNCITVKKVEFCDGINFIGDKAFALDNVDVLSGELVITFNNGLRTIGKEAFFNRKDVNSVYIPSSVEKIGDRAFYGLSGLRGVTIGDNDALVSVGKEIFVGTKWFNESNGMVILGRISFGFGTNYMASSAQNTLKAIDFRNVKIIAPYAFPNNMKLTVVELPYSIEKISEFAFYNCKGLKIVTVDAHISDIEKSVFNGCENLQKLTIGSDNDICNLFGEDIYENSYSVVREGVNHYIPNTLTDLRVDFGAQDTLSKNTYNGLKSINVLTLGEGITTVLDGAFADITNLSVINLPSSLRYLGATCPPTESAVNENAVTEGVFNNCPNLSTVVFGENSQLEIIGAKTFANTSITEFAVTPMVGYIGERAFYSTKLNNLTFQDSNIALSICAYAFSDNAFARTFILTLPKRLVSIGEGAFRGCANLSSVTLNEGLISLGKYAFGGCNLAELKIPQSTVLYAESGECLVTGLLNGNNSFGNLILYNGILISELFDNNISPALTRVTVLGGEILENQFKDIATLSYVDLRSVVKIGDYAFFGNSFNYIEIPASVTSIGNYSFANNKALTTVRFGQNSVLTNVGEYVFSDNVKLVEVYFPDSVANTDWVGIFKNCISLARTKIPDGVVNIGKEVFLNNYNLTAIEPSPSTVTIGDYAFAGCKDLVFGNNNFNHLTSVGAYAFENCKKLRGFKALHVQFIGDYAFKNCDYLSEATIINKNVSEYVTDTSKILILNISSYADALNTGALVGCDNLKVLMMGITDVVKIEATLRAIDGIIPSDGRMFVEKSVYNSLSDEIKTLSAYSHVYPYPAEVKRDELILDTETKTATIGKCTHTEDTKVIYLPSVVTIDSVTYTITKIGKEAFLNRKLVEIFIPVTVEEVGERAFYGCAQLERVTFETGGNLKRLGMEAFSECVMLNTINIPDELLYIGNNAFYNDAKLRNVDISQNSSIVSIGDYAFFGTKELRSLAFVSAVNYLGKYAFATSGIETITFNHMAIFKEIFEKTFYNCANLVTCVLPNSVIKEADDAFTGCLKLVRG